MRRINQKCVPCRLCKLDRKKVRCGLFFGAQRASDISIYSVLISEIRPNAIDVWSLGTAVPPMLRMGKEKDESLADLSVNSVGCQSKRSVFEHPAFQSLPNSKECLPLDRNWPGTRCERCVKSKLPCSEPQTSEATKRDQRDQSPLPHLTFEPRRQSSVSRDSSATPNLASHPFPSRQRPRTQTAVYTGREKRTQPLPNTSTESIARGRHCSDAPQVTLGGGQGNNRSKGHTTVVSKRVPSSIGWPVFSVPFPRDNNFTGREDILSFVEEQIRSRHRVALCGIGGIGYPTFHLALSIC
jgi:hypothetical protein